MKAAIVTAPGALPAYGDFPEPTLAPGEQRIRVHTAAISPLTRGRAAGTHYSAGAAFPFVAGVDGVGRRDDGTRVYFALPRAPYGAMAEWAVAGAAHCVAVPDDLDDATAAAIANPGMSSWAAYRERAKLKPGETVLVNGATGISGRLAVQIAKHFGAKKVIATGRNVAALKDVAALGADVTVPLVEDADALEANFKAQFAAGVDVVLDYLWGRSAERMLIAAAKASAEGVPLRVVQLGASSGAEIALPGAVLRSSAIELMGSGLGSVPLSGLLAAVAGVLRAAGPAGFKIATQTMPLADVTAAWTQPDTTRRMTLAVGS